MSGSFREKNNGINYVFQPMFAKNGQLLAVECLSRFTFNSEYAHFSPEQFFRHADSETRIGILLDQVNLIDKYKHWFYENQVIATLNVDDYSLQSLANSRFAERINAMRCIHFEISENSTRLVKDRVHGDPSLNSYSFWLDDFGSGYAGFSALYNSQFRFVKLDRFLLWDFMKKSGGAGLMRALLRFFYLNHYKVIIEGVETPEHKKWLDEMPYYALQGKLWKESSIMDLNSLLTAKYF
ncbi:Cyclic di-GMP phosphodiesterase YhjH [Serratia entomophila]|jgi:EAL domain-containing protein (putative c-di-GMP-specific phosphodiesterase class I)|uniref:EAL domain-containing protein n=1 Tax=Serratia entomophila TaxID=42906 RepID=A0ABY5CW83_9GAMM|nr:EAL domain-containing protein [Serratia entomophila]UIW19829.1 EAL domain-containing protein [Serratia entomophila]USV02351.1 EAL domain-containing protein [Serratia entomophila]CAI0727002.1 Cyclic di-GMP phosphodiesterase YhjH [Serratia entomophila]CAI0750139.1 Cyclic di-GMP phosphodiesterase YhjH [Serratia entomophila]CAI0754372.1 Cyclic di-GMP phosphodiesterase YhjH [Serratia entomophila]